MAFIVMNEIIERSTAGAIDSTRIPAASAGANGCRTPAAERGEPSPFVVWKAQASTHFTDTFLRAVPILKAKNEDCQK